jgi:two-component system phosphate regulon sensor histidine kinase PhoR
MRENTWQLEQRIQVLERERADLRRILRGLGQGVLAVDHAGVLVHANPAAVSMLGIDADTCLGSHMYVAVPHVEASDALESVLRDDGHRPRLTRELTIDGEDGQPQQLVLTVRPLRPAGARDDAPPEGAIAVVTDVTELRRLERARQDFFTNVSHELKTPITVIRGVLETVNDDSDMPREVRERFLGDANRHALRLAALVTDLLALARLEGDAGALERIDLDLGALTCEVVAAARSAATTLGVDLQVTPANAEQAAAMHVVGDEEAIRQALSNLIDNAIAHSTDGDTVTVTVSHTDGMVELSVTDSGPGIPAELHDRIFERFYRVDTARSRARGGTGIGLSIVKHVAHAHGGTVSVISEPGSGSTFLLRLPAPEPA